MVRKEDARNSREPEKIPLVEDSRWNDLQTTNQPLLGPISGEEDTWIIVVPIEHRAQVLIDAHRDLTSGHLGVEKTYERIAQDCYWPGVWHEGYQFVNECDECRRYKPDQLAPKGLMGIE